MVNFQFSKNLQHRPAQSVEHETLNLRFVATLGDICFKTGPHQSNMKMVPTGLKPCTTHVLACTLVHLWPLRRSGSERRETEFILVIQKCALARAGSSRPEPPSPAPSGPWGWRRPRARGRWARGCRTGRWTQTPTATRDTRSAPETCETQCFYKKTLDSKSMIERLIVCIAFGLLISI